MGEAVGGLFQPGLPLLGFGLRVWLLQLNRASCRDNVGDKIPSYKEPL